MPVTSNEIVVLYSKRDGDCTLWIMAPEGTGTYTHDCVTAVIGYGYPDSFRVTIKPAFEDCVSFEGCERIATFTEAKEEAAKLYEVYMGEGSYIGNPVQDKELEF